MFRQLRWLAGFTLASLILGVPARADTVSIGPQRFERYEWRASTFAMSRQDQAAIDVDATGSIVVVWSSRRQQEGRSGVYAQRFSPQGVAIDGEMNLSVWQRAHQVAPALASAGASWMTAWQSHDQDGQDGAIIARVFAEPFDGGSEILVNQVTAGNQSEPVIAQSRQGPAVVAWVSGEGRLADGTIHARILDASGHPIGDEILVSNACDRRETSPGVAFGDDDQFVIVYAAARAGETTSDFRLQRFSASGGRLGQEIRVSAPSAGSAIEPVVQRTPDGFIVAWLEPSETGGTWHVRARRLDAAGQPRGEPFRVSEDRNAPQNAPAIAVARDGRFVIAWNGVDDEGTGIVGRLFDSEGAPMGAPFRVNRHTKGRQAMRAAAGTRRLVFTDDDALLCAWSGDGGFGDASGAHVTMLSPRRLALGAARQGVTESMRPAGAPTVRLTTAQPHEPPVFDPKRRNEGQRERVLGLTDIGFTGIFDTGWTPPDPHLAAGPAHVVVMTNGAIAFFTKDGTLTFQDEIESSFGFWGSVGATSFVFDPEVIYDQLSGRFMAMATEGNVPGARSFILLAVSDDSDPNGTWFKYRFETSALAGAVFDSPNLGVDGSVVYVTGDAVGLGPAYAVFTFDKPSLLAGAPPAVMRSTTLPSETLSAGIPPVSFDDPPALYMVEHKEGAANSSVRLIALTDPLGVPTFTTTTIAVPTYGPPESPPQAGTSMRPITFDARFWSVAYRHGSLWATHHVNAGRVRARWYEFAMNGWPTSGQMPALVQSGEIDPGFPVRTYFSAITADEHGNAAMVFARSSTSEFISMATAYRYASDPPGTFGPAVIRHVSNGPYTDSDRWGDYGGINIDPVDGVTVWAHHEYQQSNSWRTWVHGLTPVFSPGDLSRDGIVDVEDLLLLLAAWGPCPPAGECPADLNFDTAVDVLDLLLLLSDWG